MLIWSFDSMGMFTQIVGGIGESRLQMLAKLEIARFQMALRNGLPSLTSQLIKQAPK
jgi:hypothetical protein